MSLADRKKEAEKDVATKNKLPNGTYRVRLSDWLFGKSQKKADMYTLIWKVIKPIKLTEELPEDMEESDLKGKKRKTRFLTGMSWHMVALLDILEQAGANLEKFDEVSDIDTILEAIEDARMPKAILTYEHDEGEQYPKTCVISEVENVLGDADDDNDEEDEKSKKSKKSKKKEKEEEEEENPDDEGDPDDPDPEDPDGEEEEEEEAEADPTPPPKKTGRSHKAKEKKVRSPGSR